MHSGSKTTLHIEGMLKSLSLGGDTPRLVHRLDKDTSGILLLARSKEAAARISELLTVNVDKTVFHDD